MTVGRNRAGEVFQTYTMPNGDKVTVMDRGVFDRAIEAAKAVVVTHKKPEPLWWERGPRYTEHRRASPTAPCEACGMLPDSPPFLCEAPDILSLLDDLAHEVKRYIGPYDPEPPASTVLERVLDLAAIVRKLAERGKA